MPPVARRSRTWPRAGVSSGRILDAAILMAAWMTMAAHVKGAHHRTGVGRG